MVSDLSTRELMFNAASKAYEDASIDPRKDVGSFICCTEDLWEGWNISDEMVPDQIGGAARPVCTIAGDAITGLGNAVMHILAGVTDVVALEAHSKAAENSIRRQKTWCLVLVLMRSTTYPQVRHMTKRKAQGMVLKMAMS